MPVNQSLTSLEAWKFRERLREGGHRVTPQREQILTALHNAPHRLSAGELCETLPELGPPTIYRNLRFLVEVGLLRAVELSGELLYEVANPVTPHHHLICRQCGAEQEIPAHAAQTFLQDLARDYHFQAEPNHLMIYGLCETCAQNPALKPLK